MWCTVLGFYNVGEYQTGNKVRQQIVEFFNFYGNARLVRQLLHNIGFYAKKKKGQKKTFTWKRRL